VPGVLLTSPVVGAAKIGAFVSLVGGAKGPMVVVDNPQNVTALEAALKALASGRRCSWMSISACTAPESPGVAGVLSLVRRVCSSKVLEFAGIQAYSGAVQHIPRLTGRERVYGRQLKHLAAVLDALTTPGSTRESYRAGAPAHLSSTAARDCSLKLNVAPMPSWIWNMKTCNYSRVRPTPIRPRCWFSACPEQ